MNWEELLYHLDVLDEHVAEDDAHNPTEANNGRVDYCYGCEVLAAAQRLETALYDYTRARGIEIDTMP